MDLAGGAVLAAARVLPCAGTGECGDCPSPERKGSLLSVGRSRGLGTVGKAESNSEFSHGIAQHPLGAAFLPTGWLGAILGNILHNQALMKPTVPIRCARSMLRTFKRLEDFPHVDIVDAKALVCVLAVIVFADWAGCIAATLVGVRRGVQLNIALDLLDVLELALHAFVRRRRAVTERCVSHSGSQRTHAN